MATEHLWERGCVCLAVLVELEKMAEKFKRFPNKKYSRIERITARLGDLFVS